MIKEIQIGDLVRVAPNKACYGNQSDIVGLVVGFVTTESPCLLFEWPTLKSAVVEWTNGVETVSGLPVLELV